MPPYVLVNEYGRYYLFEIPGEIYLTDMTMPEYEILIDMDMSYQMDVSSEPADVPADKLIFESKDENVVTVDENGLITPVGLGTADVYVYSFDKALYNYITVEVRDYMALESIDLSAPNPELAIGETTNLKTALTPVDTTRRTVTFTTSDPAIATVDKYGKVTGVASGTVTITAASGELDAEGNPITASVTLTVYKKAGSLSLPTAAVSAALSTGIIDLPQAISDSEETVLRWRVLDTAVADIKDGKLTLKALGTTTVEVTDLRSGLRASCLLLVQDTAPSRVKEVQVDGKDHFALLDDGCLYHWNSDNHPAPVLVVDDVVMFDADGSYATVLRGSGALEYRAGDGYLRKTFDLTALGNQKIAGFELQNTNSDTYFVWTEEGNLYAWGEANSNGSLGLGTTAAVENPTLVMLEDVVDVTTCNDIRTWFLTGNGDLYMAGNGHTTPTFITGNVVKIFINDSGVLYFLTQDGYLAEYNSTFGSMVYGYFGDLDSVSYSSNSVIGIRDGIPYLFDTYRNNETPIPGITNAVMTYAYEGTYYIVTEDGLLYGYGNNSIYYNHMAGMTTDNPVTKPVLIPMRPIAEDRVNLVGTNMLTKQRHRLA